MLVRYGQYQVIHIVVLHALRFKQIFETGNIQLLSSWCAGLVICRLRINDCYLCCCSLLILLQLTQLDLIGNVR